MHFYDVIINLKNKQFFYYDKKAKKSEVKNLSDNDFKILQDWIDNYDNNKSYYLKKEKKYMIEFEEWFFLFQFFNINDNIIQGTAVKKNIENRFLLIETREKQLFIGELYQFL